MEVRQSLFVGHFTGNPAGDRYVWLLIFFAPSNVLTLRHVQFHSLIDIIAQTLNSIN